MIELNPSARQHVLEAIESRKLPSNFIQTVVQWYGPVVEKIVQARISKLSQNPDAGPIVVSFNGGQGSGKSTLTAFIKILLEHQFSLQAVNLSLDDFYLTRADRLKRAEQIHPLLATRGVPGTHDIALAQETFKCLQGNLTESPCALPVFDKSQDDRAESTSWPMVEQSVDVILFEGWCNHVPVQSKAELDCAINRLEKEEDADAVWRNYVNDSLQQYHDTIFSQADLLVFLQIPSFEKVLEWRGLQERKLLDTVGDQAQGVMNEEQLHRFVQHYERLTCKGLDTLPKLADIVIRLGEHHRITAIDYKNE